MSADHESGGGFRVLIGAAAFVIIVAGMKAASALLVPFLVAVFLSVMAGPFVFWLRRNRVPASISVLITVSALIGILVGVGILVGSSINAFVQEIPTYEAQIRDQLLRLVDWLGRHDINVSRSTLTNVLDPGSAMSLLGNLLTSVGGLLTNAVLIFLTAVFILLEASSFPTKIRLNISSAEATLSGFREFARRLNKYVVIKSAMSLATGITVATWTWICGLQFWLLWGLLAFLLNYIPNLGSILAAVPAIVLALLKDGPVAALVVAVGYLAINMTLSSLLEPRFLGRGLGLSTLVVFVSLVVWAWILGPIGVLLAVPLTMTVKIALSSNERTQWIAALLGPEIGASIDGAVSERAGEDDRREER